MDSYGPAGHLQSLPWDTELPGGHWARGIGWGQCGTVVTMGALTQTCPILGLQPCLLLAVSPRARYYIHFTTHSEIQCPYMLSGDNSNCLIGLVGGPKTCKGSRTSLAHISVQ